MQDLCRPESLSQSDNPTWYLRFLPPHASHTLHTFRDPHGNLSGSRQRHIACSILLPASSCMLICQRSWGADTKQRASELPTDGKPYARVLQLLLQGANLLLPLLRVLRLLDFGQAGVDDKASPHRPLVELFVTRSNPSNAKFPMDLHVNCESLLTQVLHLTEPLPSAYCRRLALAS